MAKQLPKVLSIVFLATAFALTGCTPGAEDNTLGIEIAEPSPTSTIIHAPQGVLPYTVDGIESEKVSKVTFNYPEIWQLATNGSALGVTTDNESEVLSAFISANGEGVIVERFQTEDIIEVASSTSQDITTYLSVLPYSKIIESSITDDAKIIKSDVANNNEIEQTSRIIQGVDGYSYSVTLIQRSPSELTEEQSSYILESFTIED